MNDRFELLERIGQGASGEVWRARRREDDRVVAIKLLRRVNSAEALARFVRESELLAQVDHPNVVRLLEVGADGDRPCFVTEFVSGGTLRDLIARGPLAPPELATLARQLLSGLAACHARGILHRDLKPENVLLTQGGQVKLADLGLGRYPGNLEQLTRTGAMLGTPRYMAPEQFRGGGVDARADIYAAGVVMYEMASGHPPFQADELPALVRQHRLDPVPPLATPGLPRHYARAVRLALEKDPARRPGDASLLLRALDGEVVVATARRRGFAIALAVATAVGLGVRWAKPDPARELYARGASLLEAQRAAEAEPVLREAARLSPGGTAVQLVWAQALLRGGKLAEAERVVRESLSIAPGSAAAWHALGRIEETRNRIDAALEAYRHELACDPGRVETRNLVADLLHRRAPAVLLGVDRGPTVLGTAHP